MQSEVTLITAEQLHYLPASSNHPADTYFHFSFADYYDPNNMNFGVLRVLNDDDVRPESGFGKHPHRDMEIVTYVVRGALTHWDSATDARETLARGGVQTISAGTGVMHSEWNEGKEPCRLLQIWVLPPRNGLSVRYDSRHFSDDERENRLAHLVGSAQNPGEGGLFVNQDVNIHASEITDEATEIHFTLAPGRQAYVNCIEGELDVDGVPLSERDSLKLHSGGDMVFRAPTGHAHFIIIEMEAVDQ